MKAEEKFMRAALMQAKKAEHKLECPIGAVVVYNDKIIARAHNLREINSNALAHAEILAIGKACKKLGAWRLSGCDLYVTLEPCPMCAGAIIQSRIKHVYFGAYDKKAGCCGSVCDLFKPGMFNHNTNVIGGILEKECSSILSDFFKKLRKQKK